MQEAGTQVVVETNHGAFRIALDAARAPKTVENFLRYVDDRHYDGTIFHRIIDGFMVQGGGYDGAYAKRPTHPPVQNEADNGLKNVRAAVAMARTSDPHSATAQFFVTVADSSFLDHKEKSERGWGYTVFGQIVSGMDVVDRIKSVATGAMGPFSKDAPLEPVEIRSIRRA
jgi:peptidyl-prolyl cis-trans isomerase B (cyclophilin B)